MPFQNENIVVRRVDATKWATVEPLVYDYVDGRRFEVEPDFTTDFASVPRPLQWLAPQSGRYTPAAVLHDWFCQRGIERDVVTAREADRIFRLASEEAGVSVLLRWFMWTGIRWAAVVNRIRRPGVARDLPMMLLVTIPALIVIAPGLAGIAVGLLVYGIVWLPVQAASSIRRAIGRRGATSTGVDSDAATTG